MAPGRARREAVSSGGRAIGSRFSQLDLQVLSNSSIKRAEMMVRMCRRSETADFAEAAFILEQGCSSSNTTVEVITNQSNSRVYRLDLTSIKAMGSMMYVECTVNLCIATSSSEKCPDLCSRQAETAGSLLRSLFTSTYTVRSGPVSLVVTSPAPPVPPQGSTSPPATPAPTAAPAGQSAPASRAPEKASSVAAGVILTTICIFLQNIFP